MSAPNPVPLFVATAVARLQAAHRLLDASGNVLVYAGRPTQDDQLALAVGIAVLNTDAAPIRTATGAVLARDNDLVDVDCVVEASSGDGPDPMERMTRCYAVLDVVRAQLALATSWDIPGLVRASVGRTAWSDDQANGDQYVSVLDFVATVETSRRRR